MVARRAHNPKVVGSNPAPATNLQKKALENSCFNDYFPRFFFRYMASSFNMAFYLY